MGPDAQAWTEGAGGVTPDDGPRPGADLVDETDADLVVYMAMADDDPHGARAAWAEFYRRHVAYVYAVNLRAYAHLLGGEPGVCDLVSDTFRQAYEHAAKFDPGGVTDPDAMRRRVRAWLGWIARSLARTALRARGRLPTRLLDPSQWHPVADTDPPPVGPDPRIQRVRDAMALLTEREQIVIRVTFQWYQPDKAHQRLPNDVAADLARTLGTTPENLRQIRRRALGKIQAMLASAPADVDVGDRSDGR